MLASLLIVGLSPECRSQPPEMVTVTPETTSAALLNPGMGIYVMVGNEQQPDPNLWFMRLCGVAYHRCHWADLEPERGVYQFDEYLGPMFDYWVEQLGKRVAFRVMSESMHGRKEYVTPKWVFDAGVPGVKHKGLYAEEQTDPVFWDPLYLDLHCEFIRAFGEWADRRPGLEFVDIGSIGEWGEMHFGLHIPGRWTPEQLERAGFSEYKLTLAYRRVIDAFAEAFPHTRVFLNVGGCQNINDYAASRGLHFRQDGLGLHGASYSVESRLYPEYALKGVQCNLELIVGYDSMKARGWDPRDVIRKGLEAPLSYQNINFGGPQFLAEPPDDVREAVEHCAKRIGYRFALTEARAPRPVRSWPDMPGRLPIQQVWVNQGVAPCYENLALEWALVSPDGSATATVQAFPDVPTRQWLPGEPVAAATVLDLPPGLPPGSYALTVRLFRPEQPQQLYYLPMIEAHEPGSYHVAEVEIVPGEPGAKQTLRWDFEDGAEPEWVAPGMEAAVVGEPTHAGNGALRLVGSSESIWGYVNLAKVDLVPGARYRLSGWLLVRRLDPAGIRPTMKVGINGADGAWITNANTQRYDTGALDTWQQLTVELDCPPTGTTGDLTVERSAFDEPIEAELYLDDVELELLASP